MIAHYTGRTIDGRQFDSSRGGAPLAIRLCDLIEGWIVAMQQMCVGDKWEVYIPAEMGYGKFSQPGIPANSTLVFEIELFRDSVKYGKRTESLLVFANRKFANHAGNFIEFKL